MTTEEGEMSTETTSEAYDRDYRAKDKYEAAARAMEEILRDDDAVRGIGEDLISALGDVAHRLREESARIVRVWD